MRTNTLVLMLFIEIFKSVLIIIFYPLLDEEDSCFDPKRGKTNLHKTTLVKQALDRLPRVL